MAIVALEVVQGGYETVPGTAVAATRLLDLQPNQATLKYDQDTLIVVQAGSLASGHLAYPGAYKAGVDLKGVVTSYQDLTWFANFFTTPVTTGAGASADKTYTHVPSDIADVGKRATLEMTTNEASNAISWKLAGCAGKSFGIKWDRKGFWTMDVSLLGTLLTQGITKTAGLTKRTVRHIPAAGTKVYIDATTFGSTQLVGRVYQGEFDVTEDMVQDDVLDGGVTDPLAPASTGIRGNRKVTAKIKVRLDAATEWTAYKAGTIQKVRLSQVGAVLGSSFYSAVFDIGGVWTAYPMDEEAGYRTVTLALSGLYDSALAADWKLVCVSDQATVI